MLLEENKLLGTPMINHFLVNRLRHQLVNSFLWKTKSLRGAKISVVKKDTCDHDSTTYQLSCSIDDIDWIIESGYLVSFEIKFEGSPEW